MKKLLIIISLILSLNIINIKAQEPVQDENTPGLELNAEAAILIDAKTGMVLFQKNAHQHMYPASVTKILTVYLASINMHPETIITGSESAIFGFDRSSSHIWLDKGEQARAIDLEYAALLSSANDASNMLAEGVSKSQESFVELMNQSVSELNLSNTHFNNATGLPDENHYTTAYDMAIITRNAIRDERFLEIFSSKTYEMPATNKQKNTRVFATGNAMLKSSEFKYEYAIGGKTGWTEEAGYTMVTYASKDNMDLIAVVLKCSTPEDRYHDTKALFEYGFNNYKTIVIKGSEIESRTVEIKKGKDLWAKADFSVKVDLNILLPFDKDEASVTHEIEIRNEDNPEKIAGYLLISIDGEKVGEVMMDKKIEIYDISFEATKLPLIFKGLDYFSILVLAMFLFRNFYKFIGSFKLPE